MTLCHQVTSYPQDWIEAMVQRKRRRFAAIPVVEHLETRALLAAALGPGSAADGLEPVIVVFNDDVGDARALASGQVKAHGGRLGHVFEHTIKGFSAELPDSALQTLRNSPFIKRIEPDLLMEAFAQTLPTGVDRINAEMNSVAKIDGLDERVDVDIAILDSGIDGDHPDLNVVGGFNATVGLESEWNDNHGHGTHVAGIAGALDNDFGVVGVAPGARLWAVKVLGDNGYGNVSDIIEGIDWVTANAAEIEVANMSLGGLGVSQAYHDAIKASVNAGIVYVVASGNSYRDIIGTDFQFGTADDTIPAVYPEVATISAIADTDGQPGGLGSNTDFNNYLDDTYADLSNFSNDEGPPDYDSWYHTNNKVSSPGLGIDLMMPGIDIYSTYKDGGYAVGSGTSMAAPHAAGLAALYIAKNGRAYSADDVYTIRQAMIDEGKAWTDPDYGLQLPDPPTPNPDSPDNRVENLGWAEDNVPFPRIIINPTTGLVTSESGATATFDVVLNTQPTADVKIALSSSDLTEGTVSPSNLTFTDSNWDLPQTVTITGVDDVGTDGDIAYLIITTPAESDDPDYNGLDPVDVSVINMDVEPVLFADSFEDGQWNGKWIEDSQNDWFTSTQRRTDGSYSAEVDGRATNATLTMAQKIDLSTRNSVELTFDWYIERGFDSGEYVAVDFTPDGSNWTEIKRLRGNVDAENTWHHERIDIDPAYLTPAFKLRYRASVSHSNEDANVDNVQLIATGDPSNQSPVADAGGPYSTSEGIGVTLDGSASSDDGTIVNYAWDLDGDGHYDDAAGVSPVFVPLEPGALSVGLRVTDDDGDSSTSTATVNVANVGPTADAGGPYAGEEGSTIMLDASGSTEPGDDIVNYEWDFDGDGFDDGFGAIVAYSNPNDGSYNVAVRVTDDGGEMHEAGATVTVTNVAPTADAGGPYTTEVDVPVILTAAGSFDPGNDITDYEWDFDGDGITDAIGLTTSYSNSTVGQYEISLRVTDDDGDSSSTTTTVTVNAVATGPNLSHDEITSVGTTWQTVMLPDSYTSMVVIATPRYNSGSGPGVVRIRNAAGNTFQVRVDEVGASAFSGGVHYVVVEEGVYEETGFKMEAVKVESAITDRKTSWIGQAAAYQQSYASPVVVGQVMTTNDEAWSVFYATGASRSSPPDSLNLRIGKHVGEDSDTTRAAETLAYLVIEATQDGLLGTLPFVAGVGSDIVRGVGNGSYTYHYTAMPNAKTAVLSQAGMDGGDGGWAVLDGSHPLDPSGGTIDLVIDEDQIGDSERYHTSEQVAYFVIDPTATESSQSDEAIPFALAINVGSTSSDFDPHQLAHLTDPSPFIGNPSKLAAAAQDLESSPPRTKLALIDAALADSEDEWSEPVVADLLLCSMTSRVLDALR